MLREQWGGGVTDAAAARGAMPGKKRKIDAAMAALIVSVAVTLAVVVLTIMLVVQGYREQFARAESSAESAAHIVSVHTQWLLEASSQVLERVRESLDGQAFGNTLGDIDERLSALPDYVRISVYGPSGNVRMSNAEDPQQTNVAEQDYFLQLAAGAELAISPVIDSTDAERPAFVIARRLVANGTFSGAVVITVSDELLGDVWQSLDLAPGSTISLIREDGLVIARYPALTEPLRLSDHPLFEQYLPQSSEGVYESAVSPADGVARTVGYRRVEGQPVVAVAGVSTNQLVARFWRNAALAVGLITPGLVGLLLALWWLLRISRRDRKTREKLAAAVEQNQMLFREIHHRVKNNLQAVSSLVQLQQVPPAVKLEMGRRIAAMVAVHEHIYRTDQFGTAEVSAYLEKLVKDIVAGFDTAAAVETDIDGVHVHRDHLMPLGLIVNEALCNAIKYAFPDGREGKIEIRLKADGDNRATLTIADDGVGFDPHDPSEGMGRRLVQGLVGQIGGQMHYDNGETGSAFILIFPTLTPGETD